VIKKIENVIVKGWTIPKDCFGCPFHRIAPYKVTCTVTGTFITYEQAAKRARDCPLQPWTDYKRGAR
jgi:hypothetical protein